MNNSERISKRMHYLLSGVFAEENYAIFAFEFDTETLQYKFDFKREQMKGVQLVVGITFIGFND